MDYNLNKLNEFIQHYRNNPTEFIKLYDPNIKLSVWQKLFIKIECIKDKMFGRRFK